MDGKWDLNIPQNVGEILIIDSLIDKNEEKEKFWNKFNNKVDNFILEHIAENGPIEINELQTLLFKIGAEVQANYALDKFTKWLINIGFSVKNNIVNI